MGNGNSKYRNIALDDLTYYLSGVLNDARAYGHCYDVGSDDVLTNNQMIDVAADVLSRRHPMKLSLPISLLRALAPLIERASKVPEGAMRGMVDSLKLDAIGIHCQSARSCLARLCRIARQWQRLCAAQARFSPKKTNESQPRFHGRLRSCEYGTSREERTAMRVFVTGATGFIGFAIVQELIGAGHQVTSLARSDASAKKLTNAGARAHRGSVEDLECLRRAAAAADGAIHTAFYHKISHIPLGTRLRVMLGGAPGGIVQRFLAAAVGADRRALETIGRALSGTDRPLVATFGTLAMKPGQLATEAGKYDPNFIGAPRQDRRYAARVCYVRRSHLSNPPSANRPRRRGSRFRSADYPDSSEEEGIGIRRRRLQPMALSPPAQRRPSFPLGSREGTCGRDLSWGRRRRHCVPRNRWPHRGASERAHCQQVSG